MLNTVPQVEHEQDHQHDLRSALDNLRLRIEQSLNLNSSPGDDSHNQAQHSQALKQLAEIFHLDAFECDFLLLCAGLRLDREFAKLCAAASGAPEKSWLSFDLALQLLNAGQWRPFSADSALRYWQLLHIDDPSNTQLSALHIDESVLHYLAGQPSRDPYLAAYCLPTNALSSAASHQNNARCIARAWFASSDDGVRTLIQLTGNEASAKLAIAQQACQLHSVHLHRLDAQLLPRELQALHQLYVHLEREAQLFRVAYLFEAEFGPEQADTWRGLEYLLKRLTAPCLVAGNNSLNLASREVFKFNIKRPDYQEQAQIWHQALLQDSGPQSAELSQSITHLTDQFDLNEQQIRSIAQQWQAEEKTDEAQHLWRLCRQHIRQQINGMVRIIEPSNIDLSTLVLPTDEKQILQNIIQQVRQRHQVYQQWGFADNGASGLGICALFAGTSGTGKTLAARVIASELELDVYHVDLSALVSKYIGETEKNLEKIFSAAENSGAILLFDEADALFGKRSQVNDSKDRYANMEVSYLLQRMESYSGLSILTTNYKDNLDDAFQRRLRFIVQFPFPQAAEREQIWRKVFPEKAPLNGLDYEKLARMEIPGGIIRNIAVNAAFHASGNDGQITMAHILMAVQGEYLKSEKTLQEHLVGDW